MKKIACGDIVPGCNFKARAENEAELMQKVSDHVHEAHPEVRLTPELVTSVKSKIREE